MQSLFTADGEIVNSTEKIRSWLNLKYKDLKIDTDKKSNRTGLYNLYYKVVNKPNDYEKAEINILSNGTIILNRKNAYNENETYYGEINTRAKGSGQDGVVFIKFIRTIQNNEIDHQDYNEIFMLLHWFKIGKEFNYTRGIILGQRDEGLIFNKDLPIIEADRCLICRPTFNKITKSKEEILKLLNPDMDNKSNTITVKFDEEDEQQTITNDTKGTLIVQFDKNYCN
ncbi:MAG: hypothetical protein IPJ26_17015 [Bacteroidetes bacterium]|nr:hypothetical protein [Bacteroidota bacterium]